MLRELSITQRRFPLVAPFRIVRRQAVVTVELRQGGRIGCAKSVHCGRYGETMASKLDQVETVRGDLVNGLGRDELQARLPPGAARNALGAAPCDLESQRSSVPVWGDFTNAMVITIFINGWS